MFSHITLGTNDWPRAKTFYQAIMTALDIPQFMETEVGAAYGELTDGCVRDVDGNKVQAICHSSKG